MFRLGSTKARKLYLSNFLLSQLNLQRLFIPSGNGSPFPLVVQCTSLDVANELFDLLQPLVDELYRDPPTKFIQRASQMPEWRRICELLGEPNTEFFILLRANRIGIYTDR